MELVLTVLHDNQLYAKMSKCTFATSSIEYLGHVVSELGVNMDLAKMEAVMAWPTPTCVKDIKGLLSLSGYY